MKTKNTRLGALIYIHCTPVLYLSILLLENSYRTNRVTTFLDKCVCKSWWDVELIEILRFWKPYGVLTKFTDAEGRPTLADSISIPGIYAAGRLDMDSEGLLLLTDSARLATRLTDPKFEHPRTYLVQV